LGEKYGEVKNRENVKEQGRKGKEKGRGKRKRKGEGKL
jgi:hypothetical protein